ncbi:hypothetical protein ABZZ36_43130 [Actinacidiphila glaucinigra]|uniref:hypothetical protein n=1 Tax=Actinacidiphila glaucinigra TaxID=235986 RepID=UPI0033A133FA
MIGYTTTRDAIQGATEWASPSRASGGGPSLWAGGVIAQQYRFAMLFNGMAGPAIPRSAALPEVRTSSTSTSRLATIWPPTSAG